jgi:hypothetical protein
MALLAVALAFWLWTHVELSRVIRCDPFLRAGAAATLPEKPPKVSVIVPAHNEARNLPRALDALLVQGYPAFEVIVADDRSTDDTAAIAREYASRDARVKLFQNRELPDGWAGKPHVLHLASEQAAGEILLFLDADVALDPGALSVMVDRFVSRGLDLLSLYLRHECSGLWEGIVHVLIGVVVQLRFPVKKVNDPKFPQAMANGQDLMLRADVYREMGRHEAVKEHAQEDLLLARTMKGEGRRIETAYGFDVGSVRWYPSLGTMWSGWLRNVCGLAEGRVSVLFAAIALVLIVALVPTAALAVSALGLAGGGAWTYAVFALSAVNIALAYATFARLLRVSRGELACAWLLPGACVLFWAILFSAVVMRLTGRGLVWRGKRYSAGPNGLGA